jgi:hypothetical protein
LTWATAQFDVKNRRMFLKRVKYEELQPHLLYIGNTVTVFTRQLKLVDYGDDYTRAQLSSQQQRHALVRGAGVEQVLTNSMGTGRWLW